MVILTSFHKPGQDLEYPKTTGVEFLETRVVVMGILSNPGLESGSIRQVAQGGSDRYKQIRGIRASAGRSRQENNSSANFMEPLFSKFSLPTPPGAHCPGPDFTRFAAGFYERELHGVAGPECRRGVGGRRG